ncbi:hypothetical protein DFQ30_008354 [Apophysomyces sp. BC1015]|nr:hypothetical protein DFQ30_008354 [Apophysomyces sp. BC1015]KAG0174811.1 hypothetical protein DFQ29_007353 [Apophysomyces sp. BC1021]
MHTVLGQGNWLKLENLTYKDANGVERQWERCVRRKSESCLIDAVDIHAILLTPSPKLLLVVQYRPALGKKCIEFPSGLIDSGEDPLTAAHRELMEETGFYVNKSDMVLSSTPVSYEPGMTDSCCYVARVTIDTQKTPQQEQQLEEDESGLVSLALPLDNLQEHLTDYVRRYNDPIVVDSRVNAYAAGLSAYQHLKRN